MTARKDWPQHIAALVATNRRQHETITDLLEALEAITEMVSNQIQTSATRSTVNVARTAIQKAKGGSE